MAPKRSELKQWAKEHMKGLETATIPSFTPDLSELDEEGMEQIMAHPWSMRRG